MTDAVAISRTEFIERYQATFDKLFAFDADGVCVIREYAKWQTMKFPEMTLPGWSADVETFQRFLNFISQVTNPTRFVLAEVESVEKFTEALLVPADRLSVEKLWSRSRLPHFKTVCFDESASWCALFDNFADRLLVCRSNMMKNPAHRAARGSCCCEKGR